MRSVSRGVRVFSLSVSLGLVLAACGGSTSKKDGGNDGATDAGGTAGGDGAAGVDGGGTAGAGAAGQSGNDGGAAGADANGDVATEAGAAGIDGGGAAGAEGGVTDGGDARAQDASTDVSVDVTTTPVNLCGAYAIHAPVVVATIVDDGASPYLAGFLGGPLASGTYYLTTVVHFGATYAGPTQEVLVVDASAHTLGDASVVGTATTYVGYATTSPSATVLAGAPSCGGATATTWNYLVTGTGPGSTLSLNAVGSSDVKVFTKQ
jgi:hypothetical protein